MKNASGKAVRMGLWRHWVRGRYGANGSRNQVGARDGLDACGIVKGSQNNDIFRLPVGRHQLSGAGGFYRCDGLEVALNLGAVRLQEWRERQALAEVLRVFVGSEAGALGRDLKEHATWLAEVDRAEVEAVNHRRHMETAFGQPLAPRDMLLLVGRAEGDMVDIAGADAAEKRQVWPLDDANFRAGATRPNLEGNGGVTVLSGFGDVAEAKHVGKDGGGRREAADGERDAFQAANTIGRRDGTL